MKKKKLNWFRGAAQKKTKTTHPIGFKFQEWGGKIKWWWWWPRAAGLGGGDLELDGFEGSFPPFRDSMNTSGGFSLAGSHRVDEEWDKTQNILVGTQEVAPEVLSHLIWLRTLGGVTEIIKLISFFFPLWTIFLYLKVLKSANVTLLLSACLIKMHFSICVSYLLVGFFFFFFSYCLCSLFELLGNI